MSATPSTKGTAVLTFEAWKVKVNAEVQRRLGIGVDDLPDCPYHDWFTQRINSTQAAVRAIRAAKIG